MTKRKKRKIKPNNPRHKHCVCSQEGKLDSKGIWEKERENKDAEIEREKCQCKRKLSDFPPWFGIYCTSNKTNETKEEKNIARRQNSEGNRTDTNLWKKEFLSFTKQNKLHETKETTKKTPTFGREEKVLSGTKEMKMRKESNPTSPKTSPLKLMMMSLFSFPKRKRTIPRIGFWSIFLAGFFGFWKKG